MPRENDASAQDERCKDGASVAPERRCKISPRSGVIVYRKVGGCHILLKNSPPRPNGRAHQNIFLQKRINTNSVCQVAHYENRVPSSQGNYLPAEFFNRIVTKLRSGFVSDSGMAARSTMSRAQSASCRANSSIFVPFSALPPLQGWRGLFRWWRDVAVKSRRLVARLTVRFNQHQLRRKKIRAIIDASPSPAVSQIAESPHAASAAPKIRGAAACRIRDGAPSQPTRLP